MLTIRHDTAGNLQLSGELDSAGTRQLADALSQEPEGTNDVCLVCADVTFIDSSGIRGLARAASNLASTGRVLVLLSPGRALTRLFELPHVSSHMANIRVEYRPSSALPRHLALK